MVRPMLATDSPIHPDTVSEPIPAEGRQTDARMQCLQVWGGNSAVQTSVSTTGLDVWLYSRPHGDDHEGGDVYYLSSCSSGRITRLVLADVRGHGRTVVGLATALRHLMHRHIDRINQRKLVQAINREFVSVGEPNAFATGVIATFFLPTSTLTLTNAGHPPPLWLSGRDRTWRSLEQVSSTDGPSDVPLGLFESAHYGQVSVKLAPQDAVLCFTDGLAECVDERGDILGQEGVLRLVDEAGCQDPRELIPDILRRVGSMSDKNLTGDDVTIMLIRPNCESVSLRDNLLAPFRYVSSLFGADD